MTHLLPHFWTMFGKILLVAAIIVAIGGIGFYYGRSLNTNKMVTPTPSVMPTVTSVASPSASISGAVSPTPTALPSGKTVEGGVASHKEYTVRIPQGWSVSRDHKEKEDMDTLTIRRGDYILKIYQANTGGALLSFPDAKADGPMAQEYNGTYTDLQGVSGEVYRRYDSASTPPEGKRFLSIAQKTTDVYGAPTTFGHILYEVPLNLEKNILKEMDDMVISLKSK